MRSGRRRLLRLRRRDQGGLWLGKQLSITVARLLRGVLGERTGEALRGDMDGNSRHIRRLGCSDMLYVWNRICDGGRAAS